MLDFMVPNGPGWGKRVLEKEGSDDDFAGAISPKMLAAIDVLKASKERHGAEPDFDLTEGAGFLDVSVPYLLKLPDEGQGQNCGDY